MDFHISRRADMTLHQDEIGTFANVLVLAYQHLHSAPEQQLHGTPLMRQAGLVGPDLFRVKQLLERMGGVLGVPLPYDPPTPDLPEYPVVIYTESTS